MPARHGVRDPGDGTWQTRQSGGRTQRCEARIDEALRIARVVDTAGDEAARRCGTDPQGRREPSHDLVIGGTQPELHARTVRAGYDIEPPVFSAIPGIYSSLGGSSSAAAVLAAVAAAGRRRAGAGPEYHFFEIHMKNGTARKMDE